MFQCAVCGGEHAPLQPPALVSAQTRTAPHASSSSRESCSLPAAAAPVRHVLDLSQESDCEIDELKPGSLLAHSWSQLPSVTMVAGAAAATTSRRRCASCHSAAREAELSSDSDPDVGLPWTQSYRAKLSADPREAEVTGQRRTKSSDRDSS